MEEKTPEQGTRQRVESHRHHGSPGEEIPKQRDTLKVSSAVGSSSALAYLCFWIALVATCTSILYLYALGTNSSPTTLPTLLQPFFPRSSPDPKAIRSVPLTRKMVPLSELKTSVVRPGSGPSVAKGQRVTVHATGSVLKPDGTTKKFWSTKDPGQQPFTWQAGLGQVIAGWDQGVLGMNLGETRMIHIPAKMGYGANGFPAWGIPPNADLQFEIECLQIL
ncbi:hypothetical protein Esti_005794 [Eimeria stiedai]